MYDCFLGLIILTPYNFVPNHFAFCEGQLLAIAQNQALFSLIGTKFGGDGRETFALPDLKDKAPAGLQYVIALQGIYPTKY